MSFDRIDDRISDRIEIEKRKKQTKKKIHDGNERKDIQHWQERIFL